MYVLVNCKRKKTPLKIHAAFGQEKPVLGCFTVIFSKQIVGLAQFARSIVARGQKVKAIVRSNCVHKIRVKKARPSGSLTDILTFSEESFSHESGIFVCVVVQAVPNGRLQNKAKIVFSIIRVCASLHEQALERAF